MSRAYSPFTTRFDNSELIYKMLDAVARKYNCKFEYNCSTRTLSFKGTYEERKALNEEFVELIKQFNRNL